MTGWYICTNFKDGGFGLMQSVGPEGGVVFRLGKKEKFGIMLQSGVHALTYVDSSFEESYWGSDGAPSVLIPIGFGFTVAL